MQPVAHIGFGQVRHTRLLPLRHAFAYRTCFLMLPLRSLSQATPAASGWAINRAAPLSFFESDHGDGRAPEQGGAVSWIDEVLQQEGVHDATGELWLHTYPRVLGHTFKPVSFWYCHRAPDDQGGALRAIVVEVNNTFGERHCYLLDAPHYGVDQVAAKVFHVSPFNPVQGHYRFRFLRSEQGALARTVARIDYYQGAPEDATASATLQTSVSGTLHALTPALLRRALWRYPALTLGVVLHIHTQALRLWLKRLAFFRKPPPPTQFVTRDSPLHTGAPQ